MTVQVGRDFARTGTRTILWVGGKALGTSSGLFYMHYGESGSAKPLSAPMCFRCYVFMVAVLKGLLRKRLQSYILTSSASVQVMNAVLFPDALSCKVQIINKIGL